MGNSEFELVLRGTIDRIYECNHDYINEMLYHLLNLELSDRLSNWNIENYVVDLKKMYGIDTDEIVIARNRDNDGNCKYFLINLNCKLSYYDSCFDNYYGRFNESDTTVKLYNTLKNNGYIEINTQILNLYLRGFNGHREIFNDMDLFFECLSDFDKMKKWFIHRTCGYFFIYNLI